MMGRSAKKVMRRVKSKQALISIGDAVQVPLVQQDRAKIGAGNLSTIAVNINNHFWVSQLAAKNGIFFPSFIVFLILEIIGISMILKMPSRIGR